jgi:hypothetical protein
LEEKKIALEKKKALNDLIGEENRTMMMDPSTMNEFTREWCNMRSLEIISRGSKPVLLFRLRRLEEEVEQMVLRLRRLEEVDQMALRLRQLAASVEVLPAMMVLLELPSKLCWLMSA